MDYITIIHIIFMYIALINQQNDL